MFYEINEQKEKIRPLYGYFKGFRTELKDIDKSLLNETQLDYIAIPDNRIIEISDSEHNIFIKQQNDLNNCITNRRTAYITESDGLFFDYQRGEIEKSVWESKVEEIKQRYPKPVNS